MPSDFYNGLAAQGLTPTEKQEKFFHRLCAICRENKIHVDEHPRDRVDYMNAINRLISRLKENGVDIGKEANDEIAPETLIKEEGIRAPAYLRTEPVKFAKPISIEERLQNQIDALPIKKNDIYYSIVRKCDEGKLTNEFFIDEVQISNVGIKSNGDLMIDFKGRETLVASIKDSKLPNRICTYRQKNPYTGKLDRIHFPYYYKKRETAEKAIEKLKEMNWR